MAQQSLEDRPFQAIIEGSRADSLCFTKFSLQNLRASTNAQTVRHQANKSDHLFLSLVIEGSVRSVQYDRSIISRVGDISLRDTHAPWTIEHPEYSEVLAIEIPRNRLESILGPARHYSGLAIEAHLPVTALASSFLRNLASTADQLEPRAAERMATVAIDLVAASIAEKLAVEFPKSMRGTLVVERAKSFISANLCDPGIGPNEVASAVGVSLRHLQNLFREDGHNVAAWIWRQRLELSARRIADRACSHLTLGQLAFECGFADQAHFSRRFRDHFGLSPRDYRHAAFHRDI